MAVERPQEDLPRSLAGRGGDVAFDWPDSGALLDADFFVTGPTTWNVGITELSSAPASILFSLLPTAGGPTEAFGATVLANGGPTYTATYVQSTGSSYYYILMTVDMGPTADFTVESTYTTNMTGLSDSHQIIQVSDFISGGGITAAITNTGVVQVYVYSSAPAIVYSYSSGAGVASPTAGHLAVERYNGVFTTYVDGVAVHSAAGSGTPAICDRVLFGYGGSNSDAFIYGSAMRIGSAKYKGNFTPPAAPYDLQDDPGGAKTAANASVTIGGGPLTGDVTEAGTATAAHPVVATFPSASTEAGASAAAHPAAMLAPAAQTDAATGDSAQTMLALLGAAESEAGTAASSDTTLLASGASHTGAATGTDTPAAQADFVADETEASALEDLTDAQSESFAAQDEVPPDARKFGLQFSGDFGEVPYDVVGNAIDVSGTPVAAWGLPVTIADYYTSSFSMPFEDKDFSLFFVVTVNLFAPDVGEYIDLVTVTNVFRLYYESAGWIRIELKDDSGAVLFDAPIYAEGTFWVERVGSVIRTYGDGWLVNEFNIGTALLTTGTSVVFGGSGFAPTGGGANVSECGIILGKALVNGSEFGIQYVTPDYFQPALIGAEAPAVATASTSADQTDTATPDSEQDALASKDAADDAAATSTADPAAQADFFAVEDAAGTAVEVPAAENAVVADDAATGTATELQDGQVGADAASDEPVTSDTAQDSIAETSASVDEMLIGLNNYCSNSEFVGVTTGNVPSVDTGEFSFKSTVPTTSFCDIVAVGTEFGDPYIDVRFYGEHASNSSRSYFVLSGITLEGATRTVMTSSATLTLVGGALPQFDSSIASQVPGVKLAIMVGTIITNVGLQNGVFAPTIPSSVLQLGNRADVAYTYRHLDGTGYVYARLAILMRGIVAQTPFDFTLRISRPQFNYGENVGYSPTNGPASQVAYRRPITDNTAVGLGFPHAEPTTGTDTIEGTWETYADEQEPTTSVDETLAGVDMTSDQTDATASDAAHDATADMLADEQEPAPSDAAHDGDTGAQTASVDEMLIGLNNYCSNSEFVGVTTGALVSSDGRAEFSFRAASPATSFCDIVGTGAEFGDPYIDVRFYGSQSSPFVSGGFTLSGVLGDGPTNSHLVTVSATLTLIAGTFPERDYTLTGDAGLKLVTVSTETGSVTVIAGIPAIADPELPLGVRTYVSQTFAVTTPRWLRMGVHYYRPKGTAAYDYTIRISRPQFNFGPDVGYSPTNGPASQVAYRRPATDYFRVANSFSTSESTTADTVQDSPVTGVDADQTDTATPVEDQTATQDMTGDLAEAGAAGADHPAAAGFVSAITEAGIATELVSADGNFVATLTEAGVALAAQDFTAGTSADRVEAGAAMDTPVGTAAFVSADTAASTAADAPASTFIAPVADTEAGAAGATHDSISGNLAEGVGPGTADATQSSTQGTANDTTEPSAASDTHASTAMFPAATTDAGTATDAPVGTYTTASTQADAGTAGSTQDGQAGAFLEGTAVGTAGATHPALATFAASDAAALAANDAVNGTATMGNTIANPATATDASTAGWVTLATMTNAGIALAVQDFLAATPADHTAPGTAGSTQTTQFAQAADAQATTFALDTPAGTVVFLVSELAESFATAAQDSGGSILAQIDEAASLLEQLFAQLIGAGFIDKNVTYVLRQVAEEFVLQQNAVVTVLLTQNEEFVLRDEPETVKVVLTKQATYVED